MNRPLTVATFLASFAVSFVVGCSAEPPREVCGDGLDNDGNGVADCDDRDCAGKPECTPPNYGACPKCGQSCTTQQACVTSYVDDRPIPQCIGGKCFATTTFIQPRVELDTRANWAGLTLSPQSAATRFIKKTANDGSAVDCARVFSFASDRSDAGAIEASNVLVVQGLDVTRVTNPQLGQGVTLAFVNTQTGGNYLIWVELWGGPPGSSSKLPTGRRLGYGCFEDAASTPELTINDNCPSATLDAGSCKTFRLVMPGPEMP
jgi:hypothetical protein